MFLFKGKNKAQSTSGKKYFNIYGGETIVNKKKDYDQVMPNLPPEGTLHFIPKMIKPLSNNKIIPEKLELNEQTLESLTQQLNFWNEPGYYVDLNSVKFTTCIEKPFPSLTMSLPVFGLYKRTGVAKGQSVWVDLNEAQMLVKALTWILEKKLDNKKPKPKLDSTDPVLYKPVNLVYRGLKRDFILGDQYDKYNPAPTTQEVFMELQNNQDKVSYDTTIFTLLETVNVLCTSIAGKDYIGIFKLKGFNCHHRVWMSFHEAQYVAFSIAKGVEAAREHLQEIEEKQKEQVGAEEEDEEEEEEEEEEDVGGEGEDEEEVFLLDTQPNIFQRPNAAKRRAANPRGKATAANKKPRK